MADGMLQRACGARVASRHAAGACSAIALSGTSTVHVLQAGINLTNDTHQAI